MARCDMLALLCKNRDLDKEGFLYANVLFFSTELAISEADVAACVMEAAR